MAKTPKPDPVQQYLSDNQWVVVSINTVAAEFEVFGMFSRKQAYEIADSHPKYTVRKLRKLALMYCRQDDQPTHVRVWREDDFGDVWDSMTIAAAIEKYGRKIRYLHDCEDDNDAWSGAYLGPDGPVWPEEIVEPERKD